jgi:hypothetical protein
MCDRLPALIFPAPSIMPKDPTEKQEKKERKERKEKKKKRVVEEAPAETPTTDVPEDVEMDDNVEDTKVYFSRSRRSGLCTPATGDEKIKEREEGEAG